MTALPLWRAVLCKNTALAVNFSPLFVGISLLASWQAASIPPQLAKNCRANSVLPAMNTASKGAGLHPFYTLNFCFMIQSFWQ